MSQKRRDIKIDLSGADVRQLQFELGLSGLEITGEEAADNHFGEGTREAVLKLQEEFGLKIDGIVGDVTTKQISAELSVSESQRYILVDISKQKLNELILSTK